MISQIRGQLVYKSPEEIIIDVNGVGYGVKVPLSTFYELPGIGGDVLLQVHTYVREDTLHLYGFLTPKEKELFCLLIGVSGVGPRLAINVLSGISAQDLERALKDEDLPSLTRIPGVGRKTAERMLVELKDKVVASATAVVSGIQGKEGGMVKDALSALVNLGYTRGIAEEALRDVLREKGDDLSLEDLLKESLRLLVRH
ncbi:MAG: Holliday junction branch migration protein RuvA [Deltaproteobacteria bacterium]|nr:Holliday junction branch migration protein RuvA [Deltaproteobacteria bacterium]